MRQKIIITSLILSVIVLVIAVSFLGYRISNREKKSDTIPEDVGESVVDIDDGYAYEEPPIYDVPETEFIQQYGLKFDKAVEQTGGSYVYTFKNTDGVIAVAETVAEEIAVSDWIRRDEWEAQEEATHIIIIWSNLDYIPDGLDEIYKLMYSHDVYDGVWVSDWEEGNSSMNLTSIATDDEIEVVLGE